ncbi:MAG: hypothetical protein IKR11_12585 [Solobacterium sp.]|nr:hypothetical protein [Solobacterium sp.]
MTLKEKIQLVGLLDLYTMELAEKNIKREKDKYGCVIPTKALYSHARIISNKLSTEVESELKSIWQA